MNILQSSSKQFSTKLNILQLMNLTTLQRRSVAGTTIYSLSSGYGKCGVSIIRVSGPQTKQAIEAIVSPDFIAKPRYAHLKSLYYPHKGEMIDKGLVVWYPGPASFTGEDSCEFQVHGSIAVVEAMLKALGSLECLRPAGPGEFTKRAFFNGKLDLTEVDGIADLIHAETEAQRKQAVIQCSGVLTELYNSWRLRIIHCCAHLEAYIDFADEENIEEKVIKQLVLDIKNLMEDIQMHLNDQRKGELLRGGVRAIIIGAPNVGKSSFLNLMCQRRVSIVTPIAGTTRDIVETTNNIGGYPVLFSDTAGLHKTANDPVELEGIARAKEYLKTADLVLIIIDAQMLQKQQFFDNVNVHQFTENYLKSLDVCPEDLICKKVQIIVNKTDLLSPDEMIKLRDLEKSNILLLSCKNYSSETLETFLEQFGQILYELCGQPSPEHPRLTNARYRQQLERCAVHINTFLNEYAPDKYSDLSISAQKLRQAVRCIECITGLVSSDDILDIVFKDFCVGK